MAFKLKSADDIFPTPLLRFDVADADKLNRGLLKEIAKRREAESSMSKSNRKGWHSERDLFERKEPAQAALAHIILRMLAQATKTVAPHTDFNNIELLADGWINVNQPGAYNAPHDHIGSFWSGVYYVQVPEHEEGQGGSIEFLAPHRTLPGHGIIEAPITAQKMSVRPKPGQVLMFPATLIHWVHPNESNEDRITIAFNGHFRRRSGPMLAKRK